MKRLFAGALALLAPFLVWAASVSDEVTIQLPSDSSQYTLNNESKFTSFEVSGGTISFVMQGRDFIALRSSGRKRLDNTLNVNTTCTNTYSELRLGLDPSEPSQTVTVTPTGTCSSGGGGGGVSSGGGSSGGGSSYTPAPVVQPSTVSPQTQTAQTNVSSLQNQLAALQRQASSLQGGATVSVSITRGLALGSRGDDVKSLQQFLASDASVYPEGIANGNYGPLTRAAVQRFQEKYSIAKAGNPGYGNVGPKTRAKLNELMGTSPVAPTAPVAPSPSSQTAAPGVSSGSITRSLSFGARNDEVSTLQSMLAQDSEVYPEGIVSGYFGPATRRAVQRFQEKYSIAKAGDLGYGNVGPKTRAKLNSL